MPDAPRTHRRESVTPTELMGEGYDPGLLIADCECGGIYAVATGPREGDDLDQAQVYHALDVGAPIPLTRDQMDIVIDKVMPEPDPPWREIVNHIPGRHIVIVETVEESLPFLLGWLGAPDRP
jgi:hypothetical protein